MSRALAKVFVGYGANRTLWRMLHKEGYVWLVKEPHQQCATCYFRDEDVFQKVQNDLGAR